MQVDEEDDWHLGGLLAPCEITLVMTLSQGGDTL
jgi:hypothetical protein